MAKKKKKVKEKQGIRRGQTKNKPKKIPTGKKKEGSKKSERISEKTKNGYIKPVLRKKIQKTKL